MLKNIYIYVADSLRWDSLPDTVSDLGVTRRTIAQSNFSAPSFATLGTGLYPIQHHVHNWGEVLAPDTPTIFEIDGMNTGYRDHTEGKTVDATFDILKQDESTSLKELSPPFIHLERNSHPHVPFGENAPDNAPDYYRDRGADWEQMRRDYEHGIKKSVERFEARLEYLADEGLLEDTLVIFTSDHGELFGEHGGKGHGSPTTPELVHVPVVFINPQLEDGDIHAEPDGLIEHVDVIKTALAAIGNGDALEIPGVDLLTNKRRREWGYSHLNIVRRGKQLYSTESAWWPTGGYVFERSGFAPRMFYAASQFRDPPIRKNLPKAPTALLRTFAAEVQSYGTPPVSKQNAEESIITFRNQLPRYTRAESELGGSEREHLKDLGYLN